MVFLSGDTETTPLPDLLQTLAQPGNVGVLRLKTKPLIRIYINNHWIHAAEYGPELGGIEAFIEAVLAPPAPFIFEAMPEEDFARAVEKLPQGSHIDPPEVPALLLLEAFAARDLGRLELPSLKKTLQDEVGAGRIKAGAVFEGSRLVKSHPTPLPARTEAQLRAVRRMTAHLPARSLHVSIGKAEFIALPRGAGSLVMLLAGPPENDFLERVAAR